MLQEKCAQFSRKIQLLTLEMDKVSCVVSAKTKQIYKMSQIGVGNSICVLLVPFKQEMVNILLFVFDLAFMWVFFFNVYEHLLHKCLK